MPLPVLSNIQSFQVLDLSSNLRDGTLPLKFGGVNLKYSYNKLSGLVPQQFATKIPPKATTDLSFNDLSGQIPDSTTLWNQETTSFDGNTDLCGKPLKKLCAIPSTLSNPPNVTFNSSSPAIAAIPKTLDPNKPLRNNPSTTPRVSTNHGLKPGAIAGIAVGDLAGIGLLAVIFLFYIYQNKKKNKSDGTTKEAQSTTSNAYTFKNSPEPPTVTKETRTLATSPCLSITNGETTSETTGSDSDQSPSHLEDQSQNPNKNEAKDNRALVMVDGETELELETLLKASVYVLGSTGESIVYKAVLQSGTAFAVRRKGERGVGKMMEFEGHVRAIAKMRHQKLVKVRGFYWGDDEKLVIYDYVSNGSLANVGYRRTRSCYTYVRSRKSRLVPISFVFGNPVQLPKGLPGD